MVSSVNHANFGWSHCAFNGAHRTGKHNSPVSLRSTGGGSHEEILIQKIIVLFKRMSAANAVGPDPTLEVVLKYSNLSVAIVVSMGTVIRQADQAACLTMTIERRHPHCHHGVTLLPNLGRHRLSDGCRFQSRPGSLSLKHAV